MTSIIPFKKTAVSALIIALIACCLLFVSCNNKSETAATGTSKPEMVTYPEKKEMILQTDRAPQLETPLRVFREDITPNEYFFVRWHLSRIVSKIDIDTFRLHVGGAVNKPLALSLNDLKTKFTADSTIALTICAGNSRSSFEPRVPGTQWKNGAMGNAKWKGVRLRDILAMAGAQPGAVDVTFQGLEKGALPGIPEFVRSLAVEHAMDGEVLVAYEMNGQPIPMLNGYPLKLIVPGWYASYWVGALGNINVLKEKFNGFWMTKAYQVADNKALSESPDSLSKATVPLTAIRLHSIFVEPEAGQTVSANKACLVEGLAFNDGSGIQKVELSLDGGKTWQETRLNPEIGKYSWRRWKYDWIPKSEGTYHLCVRATDRNGTQTEKQWNRSGYARGFIEHLDVEVK